MRTKVLAAAGIAGLMLSGCSPAEPASETGSPANERNLGSFSGSVNSGTEAGFGAHVFDGLDAGAKLTVNVEPVDEPVVVELVFTDAMS